LLELEEWLKKKNEKLELFKSPLHKTRFDELKKKKFVGEKAFTLYEGNIDRVQEELEKRG